MPKKSKGNKQYRAGRAKEYQIMHKLQDEGYIVSRASGSHGVFDLIAWSKKELRFIQSKKEAEEASNPEGKYAADIKQMREIVVPTTTEEVMVSRELWISVDRKGWRIYKIS
jgi:DNA-binding PadR family transcriptional regulator